MSAIEWEQLCPGSTEVLENLVRARSGNLEEDLWGEGLDEEHPNRVISWESRGIGYSISMRATETIHLWATAWRDNEETLSRRSLVPSERVLPIPTNKDSFELSLNELLKEINPKVKLLNLRGTRQAVITSALQPYPR